MNLVEQPRHIILIAVSGAVGERTPTVLRAVLLIVTAVKITGPAPFLRADDNSVRIHAFHERGVVAKFSKHLVHGGADGMHVTMCSLPNAPFVIHDVVADPVARSRAPK